MGWIISAGKAVVSGITIVMQILEVIGVEVVFVAFEAVKLIAQLSVGLVHGIVDIAIKVVTLDLQSVSDAFIKHAKFLSELANTGFLEMAKGIEAIQQNFKTLLEVINFKYVRVVHTMGLFLSREYRNVVGNFWNTVRDISSALQLSADTLPMILRVTQTAQQTFGAMMGQSHEVSHLHWMKSISDWDGWPALKTQYTGSSFGDICNMIDSQHEMLFTWNPNHTYAQMEWLNSDEGKEWQEISGYKGGVEAYHVGLTPQVFDGIASFQRVIIGQTDLQLGILDDVVHKHLKLDKDVSDLVEKLPGDMDDKVMKAINPVRSTINSFILNDYTPAIEKINTVLNKQRLIMEELENAVAQQGLKLKKPGDLLTSVEHLSDLDRIDQEYKIAEVAGRSSKIEASEVVSDTEALATETEENWAKLTADTPEPKYTVKEAEGLIHEQGEPPKPGQSWFVGDF